MRTLLSHTAALGVVAALAFGVLFLGGGSLPVSAETMPDAATAPRSARALLPGVAEGMHGQRVARNVQVNGQRMDLDFDTLPGKTLGEAVSLYQDRLSRPGAPTMNHRLPDGSIYVITKGAHGALRGVILRQVGDARHPTVVAMPVVVKGRIRPGAEAGRLQVPLPPHHSQMVSYASQDGDRLGVNVDFLTSTHLDALARWYRHRLARAGWTPAPRAADTTTSHHARMLRYQRGAARANISFKPVKDKGTMVMIVQTRERAP